MTGVFIPQLIFPKIFFFIRDLRQFIFYLVLIYLLLQLITLHLLLLFLKNVLLHAETLFLLLQLVQLSIHVHLDCEAKPFKGLLVRLELATTVDCLLIFRMLSILLLLPCGQIRQSPSSESSKWVTIRILVILAYLLGENYLI